MHTSEIQTLPTQSFKVQYSDYNDGPHANAFYDCKMIGHALTAGLLAAAHSPTHAINVYLDLGCGTGLTAGAVTEIVDSRGTLLGLALVDALKPMLNMTFDRVVKPLLSLEIKTVMIETVCNPENCRENIRLRLSKLPSLPDVVTAQRVLLTVPLKNQAHTIQAWMSLAAPTGKLIVDICHPCRAPEIEWLCPKSVFKSSDLLWLDTFDCGAHGFQIAGEKVWGAARAHARRLTLAAGLIIENDMPAQRLPIGKELTDKQEWMKSWLAVVHHAF